MIEEVPLWIPETSPGTQEVHLLNKDTDHQVGQGIHEVNVVPQVPKTMDVFQDLSTHHSNSGVLTKGDHLPEVLKVWTNCLKINITAVYLACQLYGLFI